MLRCHRAKTCIIIQQQQLSRIRHLFSRKIFQCHAETEPRHSQKNAQPAGTLRTRAGSSEKAFRGASSSRLVTKGLLPIRASLLLWNFPFTRLRIKQHSRKGKRQKDTHVLHYHYILLHSSKNLKLLDDKHPRNPCACHMDILQGSN